MIHAQSDCHYDSPVPCQDLVRKRNLHEKTVAARCYMMIIHEAALSHTESHPRNT